MSYALEAYSIRMLLKTTLQLQFKFFHLGARKKTDMVILQQDFCNDEGRPFFLNRHLFPLNVQQIRSSFLALLFLWCSFDILLGLGRRLGCLVLATRCFLDSGDRWVGGFLRLRFSHR